MTDALLHISHADLSYERKRVLADVTLTVSERDVVVLGGPNGGGKTTLLRLMAGLLRPTAGSVERRAGLSVGYLPQYRNIDRRFPITVAEVVRSGFAGCGPVWRPYNAERRRAAEAMMDRLGIAPLAARPIDTLSGGQWQRALLGRALVSDPPLLLLDEPDTHLDAATRLLLYDTLEAEASRRAVVIVSHDPDLPPRFPGCRRLHVADGTVIADTAARPSEA